MKFSNLKSRLNYFLRFVCISVFIIYTSPNIYATNHPNGMPQQAELLKSNITYNVYISMGKNCTYNNIIDDNFIFRHTSNKSVTVNFNPDLVIINTSKNAINLPIADLVDNQQTSSSPKTLLLSLQIDENYIDTKNPFKIGVLRLKPGQDPNTAPELEGNAIVYMLANMANTESPHYKFQELPFNGVVNPNDSRLYCELNHTGNDIIYKCSCEYQGHENSKIINFGL